MGPDRWCLTPRLRGTPHSRANFRGAGAHSASARATIVMKTSTDASTTGPLARAFASLLLASCAELREADRPEPCAACHGAEGGGPPPDLSGSTDTARRGVGAHEVHLVATRVGDPIACEACHVVPERTSDPGHLQTVEEEEQSEGREPRAEVILSGIGAGGAYEREAFACVDTWCHARAGAASPEPVWTTVDGSQVACDGCHGEPPPDPHPGDARCALCHPGVDDEGALADLSRHLDGVVDVTPDKECASCHGREEDGAPPPALDGSTDTTARGVGAHMQHLQPKGPARAVACEECHLVPPEDDIQAPGHIDSGAPAEVTFGDLAARSWANPDWDGKRCAETYCHGATLRDGDVTDPEWTLVDGSQVECDSCHGNPPPEPHPAWERCDRCHPDADADGGIADASRHVDGVVDVVDWEETPCNACHGDSTADPDDDGSWAPPPALDGSDDTTAPGVGAHAEHVGGGEAGRAVACFECHVVPEDALGEGHFDATEGAEVTFAATGMARRDGADPSYEADATTCAGVYCHGATLAGGAVAEAEWTLVDGTQNECDSCHGDPPPEPHTSWERCDRCHPDADGAGGIAAASRSMHVNGVLNLVDFDALACDACHGDDAAAPAPPPALDGSTDTATPGVGAHDAHLSGALGAVVACGECHVVPQEVDAAGHFDSALPADVEFAAGGLARTGGADPSYAATTTTCASTYCHGETLLGATITDPDWTVVDGSQVECGDACHGTPPPPPHSASAACDGCHATADGVGAIVEPCLHVNGAIDGLVSGCP